MGPVAGIIPRNDIFFSAVSRDSVSHDRYRGFAFHFKPGLTDLETKMEKIGRVLGVTRGKLDRVATRENVVPSLKVGHDGLVREVDSLLAGKELLLTGNYFMGLAIEDCVSRSLSEVRRLKRLAGKS